MTMTDAMNLAAVRGLEATEEGDWCVLRKPGHGIAARGGNWPETFARLDAAEKVQALASVQSAPPSSPPEPGRLF